LASGSSTIYCKRGKKIKYKKEKINTPVIVPIKKHFRLNVLKVNPKEVKFSLLNFRYSQINKSIGIT
jgi:phage gp45-like